MSAYFSSDGTRYPRSWQVVIYHPEDRTVERLETTANKFAAEAHADALAQRFERQGLAWMVAVEEVPIVELLSENDELVVCHECKATALPAPNSEIPQDWTGTFERAFCPDCFDFDRCEPFGCGRHSYACCCP